MSYKHGSGMSVGVKWHVSAQGESASSTQPLSMSSKCPLPGPAPLEKNGPCYLFNNRGASVLPRILGKDMGICGIVAHAYYNNIFI